MMNIVLPIAGRGSRFADAGYSLPKPLIPVHGMPMIELVVHNVRPKVPHRFTFIALQEHLEQTDLRAVLKRVSPDCSIVPVDKVTEGAACTVLLSRDIINTDEPLMLANSDQYVDIDINEYLGAAGDADGLIMTMWANDNKWSFVELNASGNIVRVVEKEVISNDATVGIYNFKRGADFVRGAEQMIKKNLRVNGEFYVAPVYNELIQEKAKLVPHRIAGMHGLGVPSDLNAFLALPWTKGRVAAYLGRA